MWRPESHLPLVGWPKWTIQGITEAVRKLVPPSVFVGVDSPKPMHALVVLGEPRWRRWLFFPARRDRKRVEVVLEFSRPAEVILTVEVQPK